MTTFLYVIAAAFAVLWLGWLMVGDFTNCTACLGVALGAVSLARHEEADR